VKECDQCERIKNRAEIPAGKLRLNTVPERLTKLLVSRG